MLGIRVGGKSKLRKKCFSFLFFESFFFERSNSMFTSGNDPVEWRKLKMQNTMGEFLKR